MSLALEASSACFPVLTRTSPCSQVIDAPKADTDAKKFAAKEADMALTGSSWELWELLVW